MLWILANKPAEYLCIKNIFYSAQPSSAQTWAEPGWEIYYWFTGEKPDWLQIGYVFKLEEEENDRNQNDRYVFKLEEEEK